MGAGFEWDVIKASLGILITAAYAWMWKHERTIDANKAKIEEIAVLRRDIQEADRNRVALKMDINESLKDIKAMLASHIENRSKVDETQSTFRHEIRNYQQVVTSQIAVINEKLSRR